jgi:CRP-like cAMP-binding protein
MRETGLTDLGGAPVDTLQTLSTMERILFLRQVPLFEKLPPNDLKQIAAVTGERAFSDGTIIAEKGEAGDVLYIIVSGEVIVTAVGEDGSRTELGRRQAGEYVGEMAIISDEVRMATLTAYGDVRTLYISQREFKEILHLRPEVGLAVMSELCARLRELS